MRNSIEMGGQELDINFEPVKLPEPIETMVVQVETQLSRQRRSLAFMDQQPQRSPIKFWIQGNVIHLVKR